MRPLVLLLVLVMVSSCLAMNRKTIHTVDHRIHSDDRKQWKRQYCDQPPQHSSEQLQ
ncbi:hypothetical protein LguiB_001022 [Lonicera macranthoides]